MEVHDDDLLKFETDGAAPLPPSNDEGYIENANARIWYSTYGTGPPIILLHGGLGHSGNWSNQLPALQNHKYCIILIDTRGHGRSTRDQTPFKYELLASDVLTVMDVLKVQKAVLVGWSDGACTALILGLMRPERVTGVFFFGCNMDPSGLKEIEITPVLKRCFTRHVKDYAYLSSTPKGFSMLAEDVGKMQRTEPNYSVEELARVNVPVTIVQSENDEFIKMEHAMYLARTIPGAEFIELRGVSHFAPLQRPEVFNSAMIAFLERIGKT
jgi:pimeloyl-ACP methyl ester carboxylesterase